MNTDWVCIASFLTFFVSFSYFSFTFASPCFLLLILAFFLSSFAFFPSFVSSCFLLLPLASSCFLLLSIAIYCFFLLSLDFSYILLLSIASPCLFLTPSASSSCRLHSYNPQVKGYKVQHKPIILPIPLYPFIAVRFCASSWLTLNIDYTYYQVLPT